MSAKLDEQIAALEKRLQEAKSKKKMRDAAKSAIDNKKARAADTRKKILTGAAVLIESENDPVFSAQLAMILEARITREEDRKLLGLVLLPDITPPLSGK